MLRSNFMWKASATLPLYKAIYKQKSGYLSFKSIRHGKSGWNPAVRVDNMGWHTIYDTLDGITHKLISRDDYTARHQQRSGEQIVHTEYHTISDNVLVFQVISKSS